jgi:hypothetical protein
LRTLRERLTEIYELLLDRPSRPSAPPAVNADDAASDAYSTESKLWNNVTPEARAVLTVLIRRPGEELTKDQLARESGVRVGSGMQSLRIHRTRLGIDSPVVKRRTRQGVMYSMTAETAARFAHFTN